ncbi:hypothetical protein BIY26_03605 [Brenneria goodwinii]|uniref:DUF1435 domain-containing protein n=2 Tax=Brenneria goodwinii TaxID=1109412 RepID=A0AAE8ETU1_9GAMM|nr:DUF1435 domain-containing protein [Brenneria goodwinii]ATA27037.1 hypothetical protein AWC36_15160 [Brenneria goodwinii]MCG8159027.1 DUF1435 domain-containing protein [Brenneria goodwinii]MCG8162689.1 DUF1435 domain-containing protein [Brenneria goodwinii]MCG8168283.1 DUF1435 domain-containing protein [Brenneria goodwinii]MCG8172905.1 DUF1435 domain-containing protein [Brenneria goodwinii]
MLTAMVAACGLWGLSWCMGKHLSSAWGILLPGAIMPILAALDINLMHLKVIIAIALLATLVMLFHHRLRHYLLLPSCIALAGGLAALSVMFNLTLG